MSFKKERSTEMLKKSELVHPTQRMISSSIGAVSVALFTTPFDVVKVRMQAQLKTSTVRCSILGQYVDTICYCTQRPAFNSPVLCTIHGNIRTASIFTSNIDAFLKIARGEGILNLWKGLSPTLAQMVPQTVIYYTMYDQVKLLAGHKPGEINTLSTLFSGVFSRSLAVFAVSPVEMVRTKFQSTIKLGYSEMAVMLLHSIRYEGFMSLWRGVGSTLLRDVPFSAVFWLGVEYTKTVANQNFFYEFFGGAASGMIAAVFTQPFDVVKTHRQMELGEITSKEAFKKLPFTFTILRTLYETRGLASLYTGLYPRVLKVAPACAIMISTYEFGKRYFAKINDRNSYGD